MSELWPEAAHKIRASVGPYIQPAADGPSSSAPVPGRTQDRLSADSASSSRTVLLQSATATTLPPARLPALDANRNERGCPRRLPSSARMSDSGASPEAPGSGRRQRQPPNKRQTKTRAPANPAPDRVESDCLALAGTPSGRGHPTTQVALLP